MVCINVYIAFRYGGDDKRHTWHHAMGWILLYASLTKNLQ
jgi:hypothetical protein